MKQNFDPTCVFCKIADGVIPSYKIYEDDEILAFLDVNPVTYGHALVITKQHFDTFLSVPKDLMNKAYNVAQRIGQVQMKALGAKGINILTNCYECAGQSVRHFHIHIIPRYAAVDGFKLEFKTNLKDISLPDVVTKFKDEFTK